MSGDYYNQASFLRTCGHVLCGPCTESAKENCPICKVDFTVTDIESRHDCIAPAITSMRNIENIMGHNNLFQIANLPINLLEREGQCTKYSDISTEAKKVNYNKDSCEQSSFEFVLPKTSSGKTTLNNIKKKTPRKSKSNQQFIDTNKTKANSSRTSQQIKSETPRKSEIAAPGVDWDTVDEFECPEVVKGNIVTLKNTVKRNPMGETPLHVACKAGKVERVKEILQNGADVNAVDWGNWVPLHEAVHGKSLECAKLLLEAGSLVDVPGEDYSTPLHRAVEMKLTSVVELLINYGASGTARNRIGSTVFDVCNPEMKMLILNGIEEIKNPPKFYLESSRNVCSVYIGREARTQLLEYNFNICESIFGKSLTFCVMGSDELAYDLNVLGAILKGIMVLKENDLKGYLEARLPIKPELVPFEIRRALLKSISNRLNRQPGLFDGMNFHIMGHSSPITLNGVRYTKADLMALIKEGGGKLLVRPPSEHTVEVNLRPFHSAGTSRLVTCSNFILYDDLHKPQLLYNMSELRHVSSKWLIDCIYNFKILNV